MLIISFGSLATASNGQEAILEKEIEELLLINSQIQNNLDSCREDRVCARLSSSADDRAEVLRDFDTIDNAPEEKERGIRTVRESILSDLDVLREADTSGEGTLSTVLELSQDFEKSSGKALSAVNTLRVIETAKNCPKKCGPSVSQIAQDAQNHNSSRSNS